MTTARGFLAAALLAATALLGPTGAQAGTHTCQVRSVSYVGSRVDLTCASPTKDARTGNGIFYYAVPTSDLAATTAFLSLAQHSLANDRPLTITFVDGDTSGDDYGCLANDCRRPTALYLQ